LAEHRLTTTGHDSARWRGELGVEDLFAQSWGGQPQRKDMLFEHVHAHVDWVLQEQVTNATRRRGVSARGEPQVDWSWRWLDGDT
jgi:hypothetical protein